MLFRYSFASVFRPKRRRTGRLLVMGVLGAMGLQYLYDLYGTVLREQGDPSQALTHVFTVLVGLQGLLFYLGFLWLMGVLYSHNELASLLALPLSERLVAAAFFLPVLVRAYLLEGLLAGPALAALFQTGSPTMGQGLRLVGLLLLGPPLVLGLALLLLLFLFAHVSGRKHVWAGAIAGTLLLLVGMLFRHHAGLALYRFWEATGSPRFWIAGLGAAVLETWLVGQAVPRWWARGREGHGENNRTPAHRRHRGGRFREVGEHSPLRSLVQREWARFVSVSAYLTNYLATSVVGIVPLILLAQRLATAETGRLPQMVGDERLLHALVAGAFLLVYGLVSSGSLAAFSREGREWWTLRALPIPLARIFLAKLIANALLDLLGILPALLTACFLFPLPSSLRAGWVAAVVLSLWLQTGVKVALDALSPHFGWTEPLQPLRGLKRYVSYVVNGAVIGGCAALAMLLQRLTGAFSAQFLLFFCAIELVGLSLLVAFLVWQAEKAEAGHSSLWRRLVDQSAPPFPHLPRSKHIAAQ
ncbi:hypothetical protein [Calditerricola satsumensis]|nr:hypothetical protein [Calditerricola satsumensis]